MGKKKSWTNKQLKIAVKTSFSYRQVLIKLGLRPAGGNYEQIKRVIFEEALDIKHFTHQGWSKGMTIPREPIFSLDQILIKNSQFQSHKLKNRLFKAGLKNKSCEKCGWAETSIDGRIPVELDHINGDRHDNRIENLRILCPNCHSLEPTHRGRNKYLNNARVVEWYTRDT